MKRIVLVMTIALLASGAVTAQSMHHGMMGGSPYRAQAEEILDDAAEYKEEETPEEKREKQQEDR